MPALQEVCCAPVSVGVVREDNPPEFFIDLLKFGFFVNNQVMMGVFEKLVDLGNLDIFHRPPEME